MRKHVKNELYILRKAGTGRNSVSVLDTNSCAHDIRILAFSACCGWHYHIRKIVNNAVARVISKRWLAEWLALSKRKTVSNAVASVMSERSLAEQLDR